MVLVKTVEFKMIYSFWSVGLFLHGPSHSPLTRKLSFYFNLEYIRQKLEKKKNVADFLFIFFVSNIGRIVQIVCGLFKVKFVNK